MKKTISVTYMVIFSEPIVKGTKMYQHSKEYTFKTRSESNHPGDMFDAAYNAIHKLFGCIVKGTFTKFLPLACDSIIKEWKEVTS